VELELKTGSENALLALSNAVAEAYDLRPEPASKFRRALTLAQGE
jgi:inorganic triphosphatase YgiF